MLQVEESDWAVFTVVGPFPEAVQETWARIYSEWLAMSDYQLTGGPELLWHESPDLTKNPIAKASYGFQSVKDDD